jgi:ankyrin repeat protein
MKEQQLLEAIRKGNIEIVKQLLCEGLDINFLDDNKDSLSLGMTPLHLAIFRAGSSQKAIFSNLVELLLDSKADIQFPNHSGEPPIFFAVKYSALDILDKLIKKGADINANTENGSNIFDLIIDRYYYDQSLDTSHIDEETDLSIQDAIRKGEGPALTRMFERIDAVVKNGYNLNAGKFSAAYCILLEIHGNRFPEKGLLYLFEKGADVKEVIYDNEGNRVPIFVRAFYSKNPISCDTLFELAKLIEYDYTFTDFHGLNTAAIAAAHSNIELLQKIIEDGADINALNGILLTLAASRNKIDMVKYLVEKGINMATVNNAKTVAKENGFTEIEIYLNSK